MRRGQLRIQLVQRLVRLDLEIVERRELLEDVLVDEVQYLRGSPTVASRRETAASTASRRRRTPSTQLEVRKMKEKTLTWHVFPVHYFRLDVRREAVATQLADVLPARFAGVDAGAASRPHPLSLGRSRRFC